MSKIICNIQELIDIANAIREKTGETLEMAISEMPTKIANIIGEGGDAEDALDEEIVALLIENDLLVSVVDGDGSLLTDESDLIL